MDLRSLLLRAPKPAHQFHDESSLVWILDNRPKYLPKEYEIEDNIIKKIKRGQPWNECNDDWFTETLIKDGIHGFRHVCRVAVHTISLALQNKPNISDKEIEALMFAALLHDCRRKNDNEDLRHGTRAAEWLYKRNGVLPKHLQPFSKAIRFAISVHNDSYDKIIRRPNYKKYKFFVDVLKTADALDRYRFPIDGWWINTKFIMLTPRIKDMALAYDLMLKSEALFLQTRNNRLSIKYALEKLI